MSSKRTRLFQIATLSAALALAPLLHAQQPSGEKPAQPWMNAGLSPDQRADMVLKQMTLDQKISLLHGNGMPHVPHWQMPLTAQANGGAGYIEPFQSLASPL